MNKKIAVLAGDGIGPEVMASTLRVLDAIATKFEHQFVYQSAMVGGAAYEVCQSHCPSETLVICEQSDAILFGSVGGAVREQQQAKWLNCEINSILKIRKHFDFGINIRPIQVYPQLADNCPLKNKNIANRIDFVIFRELTGGIYFGKHQLSNLNEQRFAVDECVYHEAQIVSIAHAAFKAAKLRRKKLCSVDKANVLATSKLWREIVNEVANDYSDVELTHMLVDNCAMQMVINPQQFDVIVTENMFGDIISDLAAALPGSLGLVPSASLNKEGKGLYEPSGGSAPEIAGKGIANPTAQLLSSALMLRHSFGMDKEAKLIEDSVKNVIAKGIVTKDLATDSSNFVNTHEFVDHILASIEMHESRCKHEELN